MGAGRGRQRRSNSSITADRAGQRRTALRTLAAWYSNIGRSSMPVLNNETDDLFAANFLFHAGDTDDPVKVSEVGHRFLAEVMENVRNNGFKDGSKEMLRDLDETAPLRSLVFCYKEIQPEPLSDEEEEELYELVKDGYLDQDEDNGDVRISSNAWVRVQKIIAGREDAPPVLLVPEKVEF